MEIEYVLAVTRALSYYALNILCLIILWAGIRLIFAYQSVAKATHINELVMKVSNKFLGAFYTIGSLIVLALLRQ